MSQEESTRFYDQLNHHIFELVSSSDANERKGGILAIGKDRVSGHKTTHSPLCPLHPVSATYWMLVHICLMKFKKPVAFNSSSSPGLQEKRIFRCGGGVSEPLSDFSDSLPELRLEASFLSPPSCCVLWALVPQ